MFCDLIVIQWQYIVRVCEQIKTFTLKNTQEMMCIYNSWALIIIIIEREKKNV